MNRLFKNEKILNYFALEGHKQIEGWLSAHTLSLLYYLDKFQDGHDINGNIAEIGVYQGRFFIGLCLMLRHGEKAAAIDVFEDQHLNLDQSGVGDYEKFCHNLTLALGNWQHITTIIKADSATVTNNQLLQSIGGCKIRMFSIDGCHTATHTKSDLLLAAQAIQPGGIVILDDYENQAWPGVQQGLNSFLQRSDILAPFALAYNKLYLTTTDYLPAYQEYAAKIAMNSTDQVQHEKVAGIDTLRILTPPVETLFSNSFLCSIDFSSATLPEKYLGSGWSTPEPWGIWSQEATACIHIPIPRNAQRLMLILSFHAFVVESHPKAQIGIYINDKLVDSIEFPYGLDYQNWTYQLTEADTLHRSSLNIVFTIFSPKSPLELGLSPDQRKLGIGLRNIRFINT